MSISSGVSGSGFVAHDSVQFAEGLDGVETAPFSVLIVGRNTVFTASLDVEGGQIEAKVFARFLFYTIILLL